MKKINSKRLKIESYTIRMLTDSAVLDHVRGGYITTRPSKIFTECADVCE